MEFNRLTLALFVARIRANDAHHTLAAHHLAVPTQLLYRRPDFHDRYSWFTTVTQPPENSAEDAEAQRTQRKSA
jgi:hypothetical protein